MRISIFKVSFIVSIVFVFYFCLTGNVSASEIRIVSAEEAPTNYTYAGEFSGTTTDIVKEIKKKIGETAIIEVLPWARAYNYAKTKPNIVIFTCGRTQERIEHGFHFIGPVLTRNHILYKRKSSPLKITSLQDIKKNNLKVGAMRGDWRAIFFQNEGIQVDVATNHFMNAKKLLCGRFPLWATSDIETPSIMAELSIPLDTIEAAYIFKTASSYIMFSKDTSKEIVTKWDNALKDIQKTDFLKKTSEKWSNILEMNIGYTPDKGFYIIQ